jgi:hypothetical protein
MKKDKKTIRKNTNKPTHETATAREASRAVATFCGEPS